MADQPNQPNQQGPKEMSMELRLLIAFVLMGIVLFVTPYVYKPPAGPKGAAPPATSRQAANVTKPAPPAAVPAPTPAPLSTPGQIGAAKEETFTIDTDLYHIELSNRGGVITVWRLKKYLNSEGKPLNLVNEESLSKVPPPFSVIYKNGDQAANINYALFKATPAANGLGIDYEFSDGKTHCRKSFRFDKDSYLSRVTSDVSQNGVGVPHLLEWRGGFGDVSVLNRQSAEQVVFYDIGNSKLNVHAVSAAKKGTVTSAGDYSFAGLEDTFFAALMLPKDKTTIEVQTYKDEFLPANAAKDAKPQEFVGGGVGGDAVNDFQLFVGPKDIDILKKVDPRLPQLIDWGWFGVIAKPLFLIMHWMNDNFIRNYGWTIVLITVAINVLLLPLRFSSLKSAKKMQALQPEIKRINAKYKDIKLRDPRKAEQNQEVMDLYKKNGVNPMGGCLPMLVQLPLLYAFYKVLAVTIELRGAHWLWVTDLSQPEALPIHILPLVMIVSQFVMQKMTPNPTTDPTQAKMMAFMPLMFGFFFYNMSSGLVLYWLTSNLVGILQQWLINRASPTPAPVPVAAVSQKTTPRKKSKG